MTKSELLQQRQRELYETQQQLRKLRLDPNADIDAVAELQSRVTTLEALLPHLTDAARHESAKAQDRAVHAAPIDPASIRARLTALRNERARLDAVQTISDAERLIIRTRRRDHELSEQIAALEVRLAGALVA